LSDVSTRLGRRTEVSGHAGGAMAATCRKGDVDDSEKKSLRWGQRRRGPSAA